MCINIYILITYTYIYIYIYIYIQYIESSSSDRKMTSTGLLGEDFVLVDALPRKGGSVAGNSGCEFIPKKKHEI